MTTGTPSNPHLHDLISGYGGLPFLPSQISFVDLAEKLERLLGIPADSQGLAAVDDGATSAVRLPFAIRSRSCRTQRADLDRSGGDRSGRAGVRPYLSTASSSVGAGRAVAL